MKVNTGVALLSLSYLWCVCALLCVSALYVHPVINITPSATSSSTLMAGVRMNSPAFRQGNFSFAVTAPIISWFSSSPHDEFASCELSNTPAERARIQGNILFITLPVLQCYTETLIQQCQLLRCAGLIKGDIEAVAGLGTWSLFKASFDHSSITVPMVDIGYVYTSMCGHCTVFVRHTHALVLGMLTCICVCMYVFCTML